MECNDDIYIIKAIIEMMVARKCPNEELFAFFMKNMPKLASYSLDIPLHSNQIWIPFCQFDFEQQGQLYQEYYHYLRNVHSRTNMRPLILYIVLDYARNNNPDVPVRSENRSYLTALQNVVYIFRHELETLQKLYDKLEYSGCFLEERIIEYIFCDQTIINYLKSIGCLEKTILYASSYYWWSVDNNTPDIYVQELCNVKNIIKTMGDKRRRSLCYTIHEGSGLYTKIQVRPEEPSLTSMPGIVLRSLPLKGYIDNMPINIRSAIAKDAVGSFMINMQIHGKKVNDTLLEILAINCKDRILNELIRKHPESCQNIVFLLIFFFSGETRIELLKTLEEMRPGTMKQTLDGKGQNLLWYAFEQTNEFGELEQFLLSCGCDTENIMQNLSYRRFKELYLQYRQKE